MQSSVARQMWYHLEPIHAAVYFAPEARAAYEEAGLKGYWMGYFASRSAAFGAAPAELVMATFYNFAEHMVRRAIPDAWRFSTPERVLAARLQVAGLTTRRLLDVERPEVAEAATIAEEAARAARPEGRALFAAHATLPWPDGAHLRLWHAATLLREHRGDAHVALLLAHGIDGIQAHVLSATAGNIDRATQLQYRGLTEDDWQDATDRLRARGLIDADGTFTEDGAAFKRDLEQRTDELSLAPYESIGEERATRLLELLGALIGSAGVPYPNAMGLTQAR